MGRDGHTWATSRVIYDFHLHRIRASRRNFKFRQIETAKARVDYKQEDHMSHTPTNRELVEANYERLQKHNDTLVEALERCIAALTANGAPNCEAVKEAKAALAAAEKGA